MIKCGKCGGENREDSYFCKVCGKKLFLLPKETGPRIKKIEERIEKLGNDLKELKSTTKVSEVRKNLETLRRGISKLPSEKEFEKLKEERKALKDIKGKVEEKVKAFDKKVSEKFERARKELAKPNFCKKCGFVNEKDAKFCVKCGAGLK